MIFRFFAFCLLLNFEVFAVLPKNLVNFDIELIAPSSGVSQQLAQKIADILGKSIDIPSGNSESQIFANAKAKFQKLDRSLRSKHKILWAVRGGYGLDKIMPFVIATDYSKETKKIIVGYSDLTPLMVYFSQKYGWIAVNAPMLKDFATKTKSPESYASIASFLKNGNGIVTISDLNPINTPATRQKFFKGKITGGNITCIVSTIGTSWQMQTTGKIIFLEDTNVRSFHLDRLLTHMKNAGLFDNAVAIIFGEFGTNVSKILKAFASNMQIPVYKSTSFGHEKVNLPFVLGFTGIISLNQDKSSSAKIVMKE